MKAFPRVLILALVLLAACNEEDREPTLSSEELLRAHDWILFSVDWESGQLPDGEPDILYTVLRFGETNFSGSDHTGNFFDLGTWSQQDDVLTLDGDMYQIIELSSTKLIYQASGEAVITRLAVDK